MYITTESYLPNTHTETNKQGNTHTHIQTHTKILTSTPFLRFVKTQL